MNDEYRPAAVFIIHHSSFITSGGVRLPLRQAEFVGAVPAEPDVYVRGVGPEEGRDARGGADGRVRRQPLEVFDVGAAVVVVARRTGRAVDALAHAVILLVLQVG